MGAYNRAMLPDLLPGLSINLSASSNLIFLRFQEMVGGERYVDFELTREEGLMAAMALMTGTETVLSGIEIQVNEDERHQVSLMISTPEGVWLNGELKDTVSWGRAIWVACGMPEQTLVTVAGPYRPSVEYTEQTITLISPSGQPLWEGEDIEGQLLSRALEIGEHSEVVIKTMSSIILVRGREVGCELITHSAHVWLMPGEVAELQQDLQSIWEEEDASEETEADEAAEVSEEEPHRRPPEIVWSTEHTPRRKIRRAEGGSSLRPAVPEDASTTSPKVLSAETALQQMLE